jgi:hypothetical protein
MANPLRAATVWPSRAALAASPGPSTERYAIPLDYPRLYIWRIKTPDTADGVTILTHVGGVTGQWELVRHDDRGADLTDANVTLTVGGGSWRVMPAAILSTGRTLTIDDALAQEGDTLTITRLDVTANTLAIVNGGVGAGTLITMPVSVRAYAKLYFNGTDWLLRESAQMPS